MKQLYSKLISLFFVIIMASLFASCGNSNRKLIVDQEEADSTAVTSTVYFTSDVSAESLVKIYEALGVEATGNVAVKISTGEMGGENYLKPELIELLVKKVEGTIVECNTAYEGSRSTSEKHWETIKAHGFDKIAKVDILDEEGEEKIEVLDTTWIKYNLVGSHMKDYTFMINLAHFKGHAMGGFGGVLKNQSIGLASANGKGYIHSAGVVADAEQSWQNLPEGWDQQPEKNDPFIESMAAAAQAIANFYKDKIVYINVMNNISIDCDCDSNPSAPKIKDIGIAASLDPVALDKFCLDQVFNIEKGEGNDNSDLVERIAQRHGTHIVDYAEKIGLGYTKYVVKIVE